MAQKSVGVAEQKRYSVSEIVRRIDKLFGLVRINDGMKGKRILIKPNCTGCFSPEEGRTTHPAVLEALIRHLKKLDAEILIGESSTVGTDTLLAYEKTGISEVARKYGIRIIDFRESDYIEIENPQGRVLKRISFPREVLEADFLISLAKLKTNYVTTISCAMKNLKGLLRDRDKKESHHIGLSEAVADIYDALKRRTKAIALVDGILGSELYEPKKRGILIASDDLVACDFICAKAMGIDPEKISFLNLAIRSEKIEINILGSGIENNPVFQTCKSGLGYMGKQFGIRIVDGDPCTSCVGGLYHILNKLTQTMPESLNGLEVAIGDCKDECIHENAILFGNCACESHGKFKVRGCPPMTSDFIGTLEHRSGTIR